MHERIVLVGAAGFWSQREKVRPLLPSDVGLHFDSCLEAEDLIRRATVALVVADQPLGPTELGRFPALQVIARTGTGYDNIVMAAARARKVLVTRVAKLNAEAVSEFALGSIFELAKNFTSLHASMLRGEWQRCSALRVSELTIGIVGLGTIGRSLTEKLHHLGVRRILGWNRNPRPEIQRLTEISRLECVQLPELLSRSDMVVICVALAPETTKMIGRTELSLIKPTSYLINVSRGGVVDEEVLAEQIANGLLAGVALDVFSVEPPVGKLFETPFMKSLRDSAARGRRVLLSPHTAGLTTQSVERISEQVARNITGVLSGNLDGVEIVS